MGHVRTAWGIPYACWVLASLQRHDGHQAFRCNERQCNMQISKQLPCTTEVGQQAVPKPALQLPVSCSKIAAEQQGQKKLPSAGPGTSVVRQIWGYVRIPNIRSCCTDSLSQRSACRAGASYALHVLTWHWCNDAKSYRPVQTAGTQLHSMLASSQAVPATPDHRESQMYSPQAWVTNTPKA